MGDGLRDLETRRPARAAAVGLLKADGGYDLVDGSRDGGEKGATWRNISEVKWTGLGNGLDKGVGDSGV